MHSPDDRSDVDWLDEPVLLTEREALGWLRQVDGSVYRDRHQGDANNAWVAVVRTPSANGRAGKIILAFGESLLDAAGAAEAEWQRCWSSMGVTH